MSGHRREGFRRIASPSTGKQGPMKATLPYALMQSSPTRNGRKSSPSSSPTLQWSSESHKLKNRKSPDSRASPERSSPCPPAFRVERPKAVRGSPSPSIRRTGSFDTIAGPYLTGQWPRDIAVLCPTPTSPGNLTSDKCTQTPEEWDDSTNDKKKKGHKRSTSLGNGDQLKELQLIKQRLAKGSKLSPYTNARQSPIQGNHTALNTPCTATTTTTSTTVITSKAVAIPVSNIPKSGVPRIGRGSVEGLNQEIEKLVLKTISGKDEDEVPQVVTPDGHRAPVLELMGGMRSVDTQTPSGYGEEGRVVEEGRTSSTSGSRSQSESPSFPIIPGHMDTSRPTSRSESTESTSKEIVKIEKGGSDSVSPDLSSALKLAPSPKPNKSYAFVRGPPDGCEKIEIDESRNTKPFVKDSLFCPVKPNSFLIPSRDSAFCPLYTSYTELALKSPAQSAANQTSIGSQ